MGSVSPRTNLHVVVLFQCIPVLGGAETKSKATRGSTRRLHMDLQATGNSPSGTTSARSCVAWHMRCNTRANRSTRATLCSSVPFDNLLGPMSQIHTRKTKRTVAQLVVQPTARWMQSAAFTRRFMRFVVVCHAPCANRTVRYVIEAQPAAQYPGLAQKTSEFEGMSVFLGKHVVASESCTLPCDCAIPIQLGCSATSCPAAGCQNTLDFHVPLRHQGDPLKAICPQFINRTRHQEHPLAPRNWKKKHAVISTPYVRQLLPKTYTRMQCCPWRKNSLSACESRTAAATGDAKRVEIWWVSFCMCSHGKLRDMCAAKNHWTQSGVYRCR